MTLHKTAMFVADRYENKPVVIDTFAGKYMLVQGRVSADTLARKLNEGHETRVSYSWRDFPKVEQPYKVGTIVRDPETGHEYTYRPDLDAEAPFLMRGEFFTLAGVNEVVA